MNNYKNIPIQLEQPPAPDESVIIQSVLHEICALLERFLHTGEAGAIDLRSLPRMGSVTYVQLREWLSVGEVSATITGLRKSEFQETAFPGVWWVTHRNEKEEIVTELIEVTEIPVLLKSQREDILAGLRKMTGGLLLTE